MKKVARMRLSSNNINAEMNNENTSVHSSSSEPIVRTTGRIKKPKAVFDPSDNYLPRAQRSQIAGASIYHNVTSSSLERRASYTKATTVSPVGSSEPKDACLICRKKESKRPVFATKNPIITCQGCQRKIHKLCLKVDFENFEAIQRKYKCDQCSFCRICNNTYSNPGEEMITCSKCAKYFHLICFPTKIIKTDNLRNWKCNKCQVYNQITNGTSIPVKKIREIIGGGEPTTHIEKNENPVIDKTFDEISNIEIVPTSTSSSKRKLSDNELHSSEVFKSEAAENDELSLSPEKRKKESNTSPATISAETVSLNTISKSDSTGHCYTPSDNSDDIPDVKEWSVDQVYKYFYKHFPNEAHVFKDEEIDGRCLLLLKRSDVVKKLPIKLGPSLRIYGLILKIQAQINDPTLGWNCGL